MSLRQIVLRPGADVEGFRRAARALVQEGVEPGEVAWDTEGKSGLLGSRPPAGGAPLAVPRAVGEWVRLAVCHREPERYALLYTLIWRVLHGERALLQVESDPLVHRLARMVKSVRRDLHKMHAFLRFRRIEDAGGERFVAWFEPDHHILEATADFFVTRFRGMTWSILTPGGSLHWNRRDLRFGPPAARADAPRDDSFEAGWRRYYESTFNPARVNPTAMRAEMPKKYWRNMPETLGIAALIRGAPARVEAMIEQEAAMQLKRNPDRAVAAMREQDPRTLDELNRVIAATEPLVPGATRAVLGEGPVGADIAFVGEQPGDQEDLQGRPFVGPAGQLLDRAIADAGIARQACYVTNAVKHFKFLERGKRRIHQKPTTGEVKHYRWWLVKELELVSPKLVVALGATAVLALSGKALPVTRSRGPAEFEGRRGYITVHPSYLLRLQDEETKRRAYGEFVEDLRNVGRLAAEAQAAPARLI